MKTLLAFLLASNIALATIGAGAIWEIRTTGSDSNGGCFVAGTGTDRTLQDAAHATLTAASTVHTTTTQINVDAGDYTVAAGDVGNCLQITGGTATAGFYEITVADTGNNRWTVDRSAGTAAQTVVGAMGGAMASIGKIGGTWTAGNIIYIKAGTYSISSASTNVSGGCVSSNLLAIIVGYSTTRTVTNTDTRPLIQYGTSGVTLFTLVRGAVRNLEIDGNAQATAKLAAEGSFYGCLIRGMNTATSGLTSFTWCTATGNSAAVFVGSCTYCEAYANTATPFQSIAQGTISHSLSYDNTGATTDGFNVNSNAAIVIHSIAVGNGRDGFSTGAGSRPAVIINSHAESNGGYGYNIPFAGNQLINCSAYNNTSGRITSGTIVDQGGISITDGSVFVNAASDDYALNSTANRGALLRAAAFPASFPAGLTATYADIGAAQHQDAGGASVTVGYPIQ